MSQELPNTSLQGLDIDFKKFRYDLTSFFVKHTAGTKNLGLSLKHYPGQTSNHLNSIHLTVNANWQDELHNIEYVNRSYNRVTSTIQELDYTEYNAELVEHSPYVIECITKIEQHTNMKFGRARLLCLPPMSTLGLHNDFGAARYHVPLVTSSSALFIVDGQLGTMAKHDRLYKLSCGLQHTAINCGRKSRLHLLLVPNTDVNTVNAEERLQIAINNAEELIANADDSDRLLNPDYYERLASGIISAKAK
jgi:hypothetical protein